MTDFVIQRVIFPADRQVAALYYGYQNTTWPECDDPTPFDRRSIRVEPGTTLHTGTYFNSFFECHWRRFTKLGRLALRLRVSGRGTVRLFRRGSENGIALLGTAAFAGNDQEVILEKDPPLVHFRELGTLYFDVTAREQPVLLHRAEWVAREVAPAAVRLVAGYCTFNREPYLLKNLRLLLQDADAAENVHQVVVVDQGTKKVRAYPGFDDLPAAKVRIVEQENLGGSGGFTRSILEALGTAEATHVLLMDDDAVVEPESVFRTARFLALASAELAVGGNMLDLFRPNELFELTADIRPQFLAPTRVIGGFRVDDWKDLGPLLEVHTTRYNGWWFMAFPLNVVRRLGLPLPFFIRGDDIEFGFRLNRAGIPIAALPGVGVWHEPFYLKCRGWQHYYEVRNMLILTALHCPLSHRQVLQAFFRRLFKRLLTHDYYEAWLLCRAVRDYCRGPAILEGNPLTTHQRLLAAKDGLGAPPLPGTGHLPKGLVPPPPRSRFGKALRFLRCLIRQTLRSSPPAGVAPGYALLDRGESWWSLGLTDVVALSDPYVADYVVLRRSRTHFLRFLGRGLRAAIGLMVRHRRLQRQWQAAVATLTSPAFWAEYLGRAAALPRGEEGVTLGENADQRNAAMTRFPDHSRPPEPRHAA